MWTTRPFFFFSPDDLMMWKNWILYLTIIRNKGNGKKGGKRLFGDQIRKHLSTMVTTFVASPIREKCRLAFVRVEDRMDGAHCHRLTAAQYIALLLLPCML